MKKTNLVFLVLFITAILIGCSEPATPSAVFKKVYKAAENYDIDTFLEYSTFNSSSDGNFLLSSLYDFYHNNGKILFIRENIDGETAVVNVGFERPNSNGKFILKKIDGLWKYSGYYLPIDVFK